MMVNNGNGDLNGAPPLPPTEPPGVMKVDSTMIGGGLLTRVEPQSIGHLQQTGPLVMGPGARRDTMGGMGLPLPKLSSDQNSSVQKSKKYAMEQSIRMVLMKQTIAHQQQQAKSMQRHQAVVLMCRVYVGSINFEVKEDTIKQAFLPFGPIRSISMSWDPITQKHKGFAFVEYEVPEAAQLALEQMNGVIISGRNIKVGRPSNMPQAQQVIDDITREAKNFNRIYVASIHQDLTQDDIKSVFEAFGPIASCELAMKSVPNRHKGYCFIEYNTSQATTDAISSMNLFDLGGQYLRVGRSITPPDTKNNGPPSAVPQVMPTAAAVAAAAVTARIQAYDAVATNLGVKGTDAMSSGTDTRTTSVPTTATSGFGIKQEPMMAPGFVNHEQMASNFIKQEPMAPAAAIPPPAMLHQPPPPTAQPPPPLPPMPPSGGGGFSSMPPPGLMTFGQGPAPPLPPPNVMQPSSIAPPPPLPPLPSSGGGPPNPAEIMAKVEAEAQKKQQEELQKKLMEGQEPATLQQQENMSIKGQSARHLVMQKLMRTQTQSGVIVLRNMVGPEEVDEQLQEEIQEECSKFGRVENVIIYQERQSEEDDAEVLVKIFVEFVDPNCAKMAKNALHGRYFGGRIVQCDLYDPDLYHHRDFSA